MKTEITVIINNNIYEIKSEYEFNTLSITELIKSCVEAENLVNNEKK